MMNQKILISAFVIFGVFFLNIKVEAQIIFNETFDEANGATSGVDNIGGVAWTSVCPACLAGDHYEVQSGKMEGQDTNGPATWETSPIDISSCGVIKISLDISSVGSMEGCGTGCNSVDWVQLEYNIDGTGWQTPANANFCAGPCAGLMVIQSDDVLGGVLNYTTGCMNGGNSIQLRITVQAWAGDEFWQIDNVVLECGTNPTVDAGPDLNVCNGSSITLAASNPDNAILTWDNGITDGIAFSPSLGTTTYTVTATSGSCVSTDEVDITVTSSISFTLTSINPTTCLGGGDGAILINGLNPNTIYGVSYNNGALQGPTNMTSNAGGSILINGLAPGNYTDFLLTLSGCFGLDQSIVNLASPGAPTVGAGIDQAVCEGATVTLTASNPDGGIISWNNGVTDGVAFTPALGTLNYTATATNAVNGCSNSDVVNVTVFALPNVIVNPVAPILITSGVQNMTSSPSGGVWFAECGACIDASTGAFNPATAGLGFWDVCYTAGSFPCEVQECIVVEVTDGCIMSITIGSNNPTCFAFSDGSITINVMDQTGTATFNITDSLSNTVNVAGSNTANNLDAGLYYIIVNDDAGCQVIDSVLLVHPGEMIIDLVINQPTCYNLENGLIIADTVINYTGSYDSISYFWNPNPTGLNGLEEDSLVDIGAGVYTLLINDENGCLQSLDFEISYPDSLYLIQFGHIPAKCRMFSSQSGNGVVYAAAVGGTSPHTYLWENLQTGVTQVNTTWGGLNPGVYQITVTDNNGCTLVQQITMDSLNPIADFTLSSPQFSAEYEGNAIVNVHFENQSLNYNDTLDPNSDTTFFWNFGFDNSWILSDNINESFDQTYSVGGLYNVCLVVVNKNGCTDTACVPITIYDELFFEPINIFTPDGDGINDSFTFNDKALSIENFACTIVDRWGIVMYEMASIDDGWDGTNKNGTSCPAGVYFYYYQLTSFNGIERSGQGTVQLIRGK